MKYENVIPGRFIRRPNRFIAHVEAEGRQVICHVKNTGRCRELLTEGATVYLQKCPSSTRKTGYDLIAADKDGLLINMDSQAPNRVFREWVETGGFWPDLTLLRPEAVFGGSRFDFYLEAGERRAFVEVKGVTLEREGVVLFPDAPTERGLKHVRELTECLKQGFEAYLVFIVQMQGPRYFTPNEETDPAFASALKLAAEAGVQVLARDCRVTADSMTVDKPLPVML